MKKPSGRNHRNKYIVGFKTIQSVPAIDYYLTHLENPLFQIKEGTLLLVHYAKVSEEQAHSSVATKVDKNSFHYLKVIGCGGYSKVVLARKKDSGRLYAIKVIKKDNMYIKTSKDVYMTELNIMRKLKNLPFIVDLYYTFQTENELYFVMEPGIGGTLFHFLAHGPRGGLHTGGESSSRNQYIKFYMAEIIVALEKIHLNNIMYRDLKPENVLIGIDGHIKIADFGLSKKIRKRDDTSMTFCGSPEYIPPEMLLGMEHSRKVDFYTLGGLLYEMSVGFPPFHSDNNKNLERRILSGVIRYPHNIDSDVKDLSEWLLSMNPYDRPQEFSEIKQHAFFKDIHWGRVAKKDVVPPWVPDLYTTHVPKRFSQIPLNQVFQYTPKQKGGKSMSQNPKGDPNERFRGSLYVYDQNSDRVFRKDGQKTSYTLKEIMHLDGFDYGFEGVDEKLIRQQLEAEGIR